MRLLSPRRYVHLPHLPYPGKENYPSIPDYQRYLEKYADHFGLTPERQEIAEIKRGADCFDVRCVSGLTVQCKFVVIATGVFSHPIWPQIDGLTPGEGLKAIVMHAHDWNGPSAFVGGRILVIGSGISGVSIAEECASAGLRVMVSRRSERTRLITPRLLGLDVLHWFRPLEFLPRSFFGRFCRRGLHPPAYDNGYRKLVASGKIVELPEIKQVQGGSIRLGDGTCRDADVIVAATGYRYETPFLPQEMARMPAGHPLVNRCESRQWPGLFCVGAPCARRIDSEFLRGIASDASCVAERIRRRLNA